MAPTSTMLARLTSQSKNAVVLVRATRIWESINPQKKTLIHTNVLFVDEEGSQIAAKIWNNQKDAYFPDLITEGTVYTISNFVVVAAGKEYRPVDTDWVLNFYYRTKIEPTPDTGAVPKYKFDLTDFKDLPPLLWSTRLFIDVIGMVEAVGDMELTSKGAKKLDARIIDNSNKPMVVTLWEGKAAQMQDALSAAAGRAAFVVITGLLVKQYSSGGLVLSSTDATRTYCNIDYIPLNKLKADILANKNHTEESLPPPQRTRLVAAKADSVKQVTIQELLDTNMPAPKEVIRLLCEATITHVSRYDSWFYDSCTTCARAVRYDGDMFHCDNCPLPIKNCRKSYRINVGVQDSSGKTTFTIFNKEAERLIGLPIEKVVSELGQENITQAIPPVINNMKGKTCLFEIKITDYNSLGRDCYGVARLSETKDIPPNGSVGGTEEPGTSKRQKTT